MLAIRKATAEDIKLLASLGYDTFYETYAAFNSKSNMDKYLAGKFTEAQLSAEFHEPGAHFIIAEYEGLPAGYLKLNSASPAPDGLSGKPLELERIYVLKAHHGKGIGRLFLEYCIHFAIENAHNVIWLIVWRENTRALGFYTSFGFEKFGIMKFVLGDDIQDDHIMKLEITNQRIL